MSAVLALTEQEVARPLEPGLRPWQFRLLVAVLRFNPKRGADICRMLTFAERREGRAREILSELENFCYREGILRSELFLNDDSARSVHLSALDRLLEDLCRRVLDMEPRDVLGEPVLHYRY